MSRLPDRLPARVAVNRLEKASRGSASLFVRFSLVGAAGFVVDVATLYAAMFLLGLEPIPARVPAFLVAATFTWLANRLFTFGPSRDEPLREWLRFLVANSLGSAVNFAVYILMIGVIGSADGSAALAVALGSIAGLAFNFVASRAYVFIRSR